MQRIANCDRPALPILGALIIPREQKMTLAKHYILGTVKRTDKFSKAK